MMRVFEAKALAHKIAVIIERCDLTRETAVEAKGAELERRGLDRRRAEIKFTNIKLPTAGS